MIRLEIPKEQIPYIRTIEGRKFKDGFWLFPESSLNRLIELGLIESVQSIAQERKQFELSDHLYKYQKDIVNTALNAQCYAIFADTGTGKTHMGLEIAKHHNKVLVVTPLSIIETAWINDCKVFYPNKKIVSLWNKSKQERINRLKSESDIYVINFEGLKIIYNDIIKSNFDCLIIDESSKLKNHKSEISQIVLKLSDRFQNKYILSGCPTPNHNSEIFAQIKVVNNEVFGNNYYGFLAKYFNQDMTNPHRWYQTDENKEKFYNRLSVQSIFINKNDCLDLPDKTFTVREYGLSSDQNKLYCNLVQDIQDNINKWSKFEFTAKLMKLRQVLSGFIINKDDSITTFDNNKETELEAILDELGDKQVIVWCQFVHEIETLSQKFNGIGLTSKTPNRDEIITQFKEGKIKRLFAHPKLIGKGVTLVNCNYNIYYSLSFSYEEFKQSQDRIHRIGQNNKCTYIILQCKQTLDEVIYRCLLKKKNAVDELYMMLGLKGVKPEFSITKII